MTGFDGISPHSTIPSFSHQQVQTACDEFQSLITEDWIQDSETQSRSSLEEI
jgi:hypothetical protein